MCTPNLSPKYMDTGRPSVRRAGRFVRTPTPLRLLLFRKSLVDIKGIFLSPSTPLRPCEDTRDLLRLDSNLGSYPGTLGERRKYFTPLKGRVPTKLLLYTFGKLYLVLIIDHYPRQY